MNELILLNRNETITFCCGLILCNCFGCLPQADEKQALLSNETVLRLCRKTQKFRCGLIFDFFSTFMQPTKISDGYTGKSSSKHIKSNLTRMYHLFQTLLVPFAERYGLYYEKIINSTLRTRFIVLDGSLHEK